MSGGAQLKYRNQPTEVDGQRFSSKKEAKRYGELKLLEKAGEITQLRTQPRYPLHVNDALICTYVADFSYLTRDGAKVIEDVKSEATRKNPVYRIKRKFFEAAYGLPIREV